MRDNTFAVTSTQLELESVLLASRSKESKEVLSDENISDLTSRLSMMMRFHMEHSDETAQQLTIACGRAIGSVMETLRGGDKKITIAVRAHAFHIESDNGMHTVYALSFLNRTPTSNTFQDDERVIAWFVSNAAEDHIGAVVFTTQGNGNPIQHSVEWLINVLNEVHRATNEHPDTHAFQSNDGEEMVPLEHASQGDAELAKKVRLALAMNTLRKAMDEDRRLDQ